MHLSPNQRTFVLTSLFLIFLSSVFGWLLFEQNQLLKRNLKLPLEKEASPTPTTATSPTITLTNTPAPTHTILPSSEAKQKNGNALLTLPDDTLAMIKNSFIQTESDGYRANINFQELPWMHEIDKILLSNTDKGVYGFTISYNPEGKGDTVNFVKLDKDKLTPLTENQPQNALETIGMKLASDLDLSLQDFYIYVPTNTVFLMKDFKYSPKARPNDNQKVIYFGKPSKDQRLVDFGFPFEWQVLGTYPVINAAYEVSSFLAYLPSKNILLVKVTGGDGWSGWTRTYTFNLKNGIQKEVKKCFDCNLLGVYKDQLVMTQSILKKPVDSGLALKSIYLLDPVSLKRDTILSNLDRDDKLQVSASYNKNRFYSSLKKGLIYLKTETQYYLVNLEAKTITEVEPPTPTSITQTH